ncbi:four helix bundle protein [Candidatus Wirthbacteria bacterium CG2_30_54_11]|uniref:Four helix bundle protein n=1 Tax=Candidatus Wirthbacteria bacterium CG2_30_54_11 TaxID=1817892 RepID=A0A1J5ITJ4_9BACT|nr:MAG: four helix bundle protein [Candidatus Wirthbacteria bacterium CG2_30_54_11]
MDKSYKDLIVWQKAIDLVTDIYQVTKHFPKDELYGLTSQIRRSAVSIPSNIAEGECRQSSKELGQFLSIAWGSCAELETQLLIASRLGYLEAERYLKLDSLRQEISKMIFALRKSLS